LFYSRRIGRQPQLLNRYGGVGSPTATPILGAGKLTGLFRENALLERRCRAKHDSVCSYEFVF
jgi:hypothetical protein